MLFLLASLLLANPCSSADCFDNNSPSYHFFVSDKNLKTDPTIEVLHRAIDTCLGGEIIRMRHMIFVDYMVNARERGYIQFFMNHHHRIDRWEFHCVRDCKCGYEYEENLDFVSTKQGCSTRVEDMSSASFTETVKNMLGGGKTMIGFKIRISYEHYRRYGDPTDEEVTEFGACFARESVGRLGVAHLFTTFPNIHNYCPTNYQSYLQLLDTLIEPPKPETSERVPLPPNSTVGKTRNLATTEKNSSKTTILILVVVVLSLILLIGVLLVVRKIRQPKRRKRRGTPEPPGHYEERLKSRHGKSKKTANYGKSKKTATYGKSRAGQSQKSVGGPMQTAKMESKTGPTPR